MEKRISRLVGNVCFLKLGSVLAGFSIWRYVEFFFLKASITNLHVLMSNVSFGQ